MHAKPIMLQGTGSSVGKSLLVTALCRIFAEDGCRVAPFKSQNMALNSYITHLGEEMGRAQVVQAEASRVLPSALMNPILLKPTGDKNAQVILMGEVHGNMSALEYHNFKPALAGLVKEAYEKLASQYEIIVLEGAGSPAEINLKEHDLVNMGMAEMCDAPVILIGDIDKGGVFAALYGTVMLLPAEERRRIKGVIVNKFRGDPEILEPGIKMLEELIGLPVVGVIPYLEINIDEEDSASDEFTRIHNSRGEIIVEVLRLPHISNFTDFMALRNFPDVCLRYVNPGERPGDPDLLILPGSKNTMADLEYLRKQGLDKDIKSLRDRGRLVMGICGGYQMLGKRLQDPYSSEGEIQSMEGLGLLDLNTVFAKDKITAQAKASIVSKGSPYLEGLAGEMLEGYEIHMGISSLGGECQPLLIMEKKPGETAGAMDGAVSARGNILGTYLHGIFDNTRFTRGLLNNIRRQKGLEPIMDVPQSYREYKEQEYSRLADHVRKNLNMDWIYRLLACQEKGEIEP